MGHVIWTAFHTSWHSQSLLTGNKAILRLLHHITSILDFYIIRHWYPPSSMSGNSCRSLTSNPAGIWKNCWQLPMTKGYVYFWKTWLAFQNQKQMLPAIFRQMTCGWNKGLNSSVTFELPDMFWSLTQLKMDGFSFNLDEKKALIEEEIDLQS